MPRAKPTMPQTFVKFQVPLAMRQELEALATQHDRSLSDMARLVIGAGLPVVKATRPAVDQIREAVNA